MPKLIFHTFSIANSSNNIINCDIRYNAGSDGLPLVIIIHGFKAYKDWGFFPYISEKIAEAGAITLCFDFSKNGIIDPVRSLVDVDVFANNTVASEIGDAESVINHAENYLKENSRIWNGEIYLLGHSLGAGIAILISKNDVRIKKLVLWAPVSHFDRTTTRQNKQWRKDGFLSFVNSKTKQELKLNVSYLEDIKCNREKYSLTDAISKIDIPMLIVHGKQDLTIRQKEIDELIKSAKSSLTLEYIDRTGHTFGIEHPFKNSTFALEKALDFTTSFFGIK